MCLATYGVQEAEITEDSLRNSICITCIFARGTSAQGCYISLQENHDSVTTNTTGLRIEKEGGSLNATGCIENLDGGLYHVVVYDIEANGTVDWHNSALSLTTALNWTSLDKPNTGKCYHRSNRSIICFPYCVNLRNCSHAGHRLLFAERSPLITNLVHAC